MYLVKIFIIMLNITYFSIELSKASFEITKLSAKMSNDSLRSNYLGKSLPTKIKFYVLN